MPVFSLSTSASSAPAERDLLRGKLLLLSRRYGAARRAANDCRPLYLRVSANTECRSRGIGSWHDRKDIAHQLSVLAADPIGRDASFSNSPTNTSVTAASGRQWSVAYSGEQELLAVLQCSTASDPMRAPRSATALPMQKAVYSAQRATTVNPQHVF
jgi:hypothetical protein